MPATRTITDIYVDFCQCNNLLPPLNNPENLQNPGDVVSSKNRVNSCKSHIIRDIRVFCNIAVTYYLPSSNLKK
jgi:hypothetical protein